MSVIDISVPLRRGMPLWPGSADFRLEGTALTVDTHAGTHVDAPSHFIDGGESVERLSLETLCGPAAVAGLTGAEAIDAGLLSALKLPRGIKRLLLKTRNSALWKEAAFNPGYAALTDDAAEWMVEKGIRLVGIDYLSVQPYKKPSSVHRILLGRGVVVLEGLNLASAADGEYELICLPLRLVGADGAPARAFLRPLERRGTK